MTLGTNINIYKDIFMTLGTNIKHNQTVQRLSTIIPSTFITESCPCVNFSTKVVSPQLLLNTLRYFCETWYKYKI